MHTASQGRRDSNPQPSVLETDALPVEPLPYFYYRLKIEFGVLISDRIAARSPHSAYKQHAIKSACLLMGNMRSTPATKLF